MDGSSVGHIDEETRENVYFRNVLRTTRHSQQVAMSLNLGEDIGMEVHPNVEQLIKIEQGRGLSILDGAEIPIEAGDIVTVIPGTKHNIINNGGTIMKLYTIYTPPNHPPGTVHKTKAEAGSDSDDIAPQKAKEGNNSLNEIGCAYCKISPAKFMCGQCNKVRYCSKKCVSKGWGTHFKLCS